MALCGCSEVKEDLRIGSGMIDPEITIDGSVVSSDSSDPSATVSPVPSVSDLTVRLTDETGEYSKEWPTLSDFPTKEPFRPGEYKIEAYYGNADREGYDAPYFYGMMKFSVMDGTTTTIPLECTLANTMVRVRFTDAFRSEFVDCSVELHSSGGRYFTSIGNETRQLFLRPGDISLMVNLLLVGGTRINFIPVTIKDALPRYLYNVVLDLVREGDTPCVVISFDEKIQADDVKVPLTPEFIAAAEPVVTTEGFRSGSRITVKEGEQPSEPLKMKVETQSLQSLILSVTDPTLLAQGWPEETDLMNAPREQIETMKRLGLVMSDLSNLGGEIDFTGVIHNLRSQADHRISDFTLVAKNTSMKASEPRTLAVFVEPVDLTLKSYSEAIVGVNKAEVVVSCPSADLSENIGVEIQDKTGAWVPAKILSVTERDYALYALSFETPDGTDDMNVRLLYCGAVKAEYKLKRVSPAYTLKVDAYALKAVVMVVPADPDMRSIITSSLNVYANGRQATLLDRDPEAGIITITGLESNTVYSIKATVMPSPKEGDFCEAVNIVTEREYQLPNGTFEEIKNTIDYKSMLSGGRYSQNIVEIYNQQNYTSFALSTPVGWANTNAKTFCLGARNHNTWYLAPSVYTVTDVYSGAYAVRIDNVAWDPDGQPIPDYRQEGQPYVKYSRNVPEIAYRAVGKLFLGEYSFDVAQCRETYSEGLAIPSRPSALNGFYKFIPGHDVSEDKGLAQIEIMGYIDGEEQVIARASAALSTATSYTAFTVPIVYTRFGVKATGVRVMLASSVNAGTIAEETASVVTTPDIAASTSKGSSLWIDELTLSY